MFNILLICLGKLIIYFSKTLNLGNGSTWPGHIALNINRNFIKDLLKTNDKRLKTVLVAGTNGKTTTGKLIQTILEKANYKVFQNESGANLLNGVASSLLLRSSILCKMNYDFAIFEIDENTLSLILEEIPSPDFVVILNLFRDQLDRYGEVNTIAAKWKIALSKLSSKTKLILNADDPQIENFNFRHIVKAIPIPYRKRSYASVYCFGLNDKKLALSNHQHASDSTYCPECSSKLDYSSVYYSHLGAWKCPKCKNARPNINVKSAPFYPLSGIYNRYNTLAAVLVSRKIGIKESIIEKALKEFQPAFGRQEILKLNGKKVQIFLSKNPTSFNESLRTVDVLGAKNILIILNDRIPDGTDVSWIWDIDLENFIHKFKNVTVSGDRAYDMGLRIKYATQNSKLKSQNYNSKLKIYEELSNAIKESFNSLPKNETLYILPTYSAMLELREILTGKKIL